MRKYLVAAVVATAGTLAPLSIPAAQAGTGGQPPPPGAVSAIRPVPAPQTCLNYS